MLSMVYFFSFFSVALPQAESNITVASAPLIIFINRRLFFICKFPFVINSSYFTTDNAGNSPKRPFPSYSDHTVNSIVERLSLNTVDLFSSLKDNGNIAATFLDCQLML